MMRKALLVLAVLVGVGLAASVVKTSVFFKDGSRNQLLSGGSAVCTTQAISVTTQPFVSLFFNTYTLGVSDSARFNVTFQWGSDSSHFANGIDTVKIGCYSDVGDTMRSLSRRYGEEFYPRVATHIRFLFSAIADNSDSAYIDSIFLVGQTIN